MMKYILILILSLYSFSIPTEIIEIGCKNEDIAVRCLRDFITGEQNGGSFSQVSGPQDLSSLLVGDNPCFEWNNKACGIYVFRYTVITQCCTDVSPNITVRKCCASVTITCN